MAQVNVAIAITSNYKGAPGFKRAERDVKGFRRQVGRAANSVRAFQFVLAGVTIATLTIWGKKLVDAASQLQLLQIRLNNVEGSAAAGNARFKSMFETFRNAPFEIEKVVDGFVRLRSAGVGAEQAQKTMRAIVDAVALFGGTTAELQRATIGFQQVVGKGVLSMEELRQQIGEAIPAAMAIMSRQAGVSIGTFVEQVKNGMVSARDAVTFFTEGVEEQFGGFAESLAPTISGTIARARNQITESFAGFLNNTDFSARIAATIEVIARRIREFIGSLDQSTVDRFWKAFEGVAQIIWGVVRALGGLTAASFELLGMIGNVVGAAGGSGITVGIITAMLFGAPVGFIFGLFTALFLNMQEFRDRFRGLSDDARQRISELRDEIRDLQRQQGRAGSLEEADRIGEKIAGLQAQIEGMLLSGGAAQRSFAEFPDVLEDINKSLEDMQFRQVQGGILSLGGDISGLTERLVDLDRAASGASSGGIAGFQKQIDSFRSRLGQITGGESKDKFLDNLMSDFKEQVGESLTAVMNLPVERQAEAFIKLAEGVQRAKDEHQQLGGRIDEINNKLNKLQAERTAAAFEQVSNDVEKAKMSLGGFLVSEDQQRLDSYNLKVAQTVLKFQQYKTSLESAVDSNEALRPILDLVNQALKDFGPLADRGRQAIEKLNAASRQVSVAQHNLEMEQIRQRIEGIKQQQKTGLQILFNDELGNQVLETKNRLTIDLLQINVDLARLNEEMAGLDAETDAQRIKDLERMIELTEKLKGLKIKQRDETTKTGELEKQTWESIGRTIQNSVVNGLEAAITGHKKLKDVGLELWSSLIRKAAEYIVKLLIIKALEAVGVPAGFFPFANGGAFKGQITPFADGGLVRGPTLFGLAGEAGTEAIMPLKRINGKLGVSAEGAMGGDTFNINISAVDTQTGAKFLMDNMSTIVQGMQHETSLNRGMRRQP